MKAKNVQAVCAKKFDDFLKHVQDESVRSTIEQNAIITGGAIASMLLGEEVHDFDIYLRTKEACATVAAYFVKVFCENPPTRFKGGEKQIDVRVDAEHEDRVKIIVQSAGIASEERVDEYEYFEQTDPEQGNAAEYVGKVLNIVEDASSGSKPKYRPVFLSSNAITLSDKVQIVTRFFGEPEEIHRNYDFVHCTSYWTSWDRRLHLRSEAIEALLAKELRYIGSKYPLCSIIRARKFVQRGWSCTAGQYLKMAVQLNELNLMDINVLEEQLTGVDVAYFEQVIAALRERDNATVDAAYLVELVDRIF